MATAFATHSVPQRYNLVRDICVQFAFHAMYASHVLPAPCRSRTLDLQSNQPPTLWSKQKFRLSFPHDGTCSLPFVRDQPRLAR